MISRPTLFSAPGGDTVQIRETAASLKLKGVEVEIILSDSKINYSKFDLLHFFNVIRPNNIIPHSRNSKLPYVVSTIFVDYSEVEEKVNAGISKKIIKSFGSDGLEYIKTIARSIKNKESLIDWKYLFRGHKKSVELVLNNASVLLPNSENEYKRLQKRYSFSADYTVIPNAVNSIFLNEKVELENKKGVICVARIEPIKNQLNLIKAVKDTNINLKIIGKPAPNHTGYYEQCKLEATDNVEFLGQLDRNQVIEELKRAKVHILPSWFETTGLSSLEAGALGCNVVITDKGDTREYFNELALYCLPESPKSIRQSLLIAIGKSNNFDLRKYILENYTWELAAEKTANTYQKTLR